MLHPNLMGFTPPKLCACRNSLYLNIHCVLTQYHHVRHLKSTSHIRCVACHILFIFSLVSSEGTCGICINMAT